MDNQHKYDDIINMPRHISLKHKPMAIKDRAAQFLPFAALTGYDDEIKETARLTDEKIYLSEETTSVINKKICIKIVHVFFIKFIFNILNFLFVFCRMKLP